MLPVVVALSSHFFTARPHPVFGSSYRFYVLLAGASQRDCTSYYGFLAEEADRLSAVLEAFFAAEVCKKFPDPDCEY